MDAQVLQEIRDTLKKSPALNGGFDRLLVTVEFIKEKQEETTDELKKMNLSLYNPETGVHTRLQSLEVHLKHQNEILSNHMHNDIKELEAVNESLSALVDKHDATDIVINRLKQTVGPNLESLDAIVKFRNSFDKLYWLLITGVVTSLGKIFWDLFIKR